MKCTRMLLCGLLLLGFGNAGAAAAQGKPGKDSKTAGEKVREALPEAVPVFTRDERIRITDWFRTNQSGLPPGLAKREKLPPGLEKQLRKRGKLPPGLQKKIQPLPPGLERDLRILPTGYRRAVIAGNVILMNEKTGVIYDLIRNAIP